MSQQYQIYPQLLEMATWRLDNETARQKVAFAPPGDPAAGGAPPMDPMAAGAAAPPMDPMAAGGAPPVDPMAGGGAESAMDPMAGGMPPGGGAGAMPPEIQMAIDQAVQTAVANQGAAAPAGPGGGTKKIDPAFMYMELSRIRKLITNLYQQTGMPLPDDILEDQTTAQALMGSQPQSQPTDAAASAPADAAASAALPGIAGQTPISPIEPAKTAANILGANDVGQPISAATFQKQSKNLDVLAALARSLNSNAH